jgi:hypothetical protein
MPSVLARLAILCLVLIGGVGEADERSLDKGVIINATVDQPWEPCAGASHGAP